MSEDQNPTSTIPFKREVTRRRIPGTHKIEIVYAFRDPLNPYNETYTREIVMEKEESAGSK